MMTSISGIDPATVPLSWQLYQDDKPSGGPFDKAFDVLGKQMAHLSEQAKEYYKTLEAKTALSKEGQQHLSKLEQKLKEVLKKEPKEGEKDKPPTVSLAPETIAFLKKNVALPEDWITWDREYSKDDLSKAIELLQSFNTAQTDFVAESQLKIQRIMQTYNTTATLLNSLQSMLSEINKTIIQALR